jgi:uncharacterized repeat protein (TIGR01451 family)
MNHELRQPVSELLTRWQARISQGQQQRRGLIAIASVLLGILAFAGLCAGLTRATASQPPVKAAALVSELTAGPEDIGKVDTVIIYDHSGSMEMATLCYGCWEPANPPTSTVPTIYPLLWSTVSPTATATHCGTNSAYSPYGSFWRNDFNYTRTVSSVNYYYIVVEAEEYSYMRPEADYHTWAYTPYKTFWVIQRNGQGSTGRDARGGYLSHDPYTNHENTQNGMGAGCTWTDLNNPDAAKCGDGMSGGDDSCCLRIWSDGSPVAGGPFAAPRADYDFDAPIAITYSFWIRGQGGNNWGVPPNNNYIFWGTDQTIRGEKGGFSPGAAYDGASSSAWDWRCLGSVSLSQGNHTLNLWAGGAGFDVDRILITMSSTNCSADTDPPDSSGSLFANNARTRWACNACDPRFAGRPGGLLDGTNWRPDCHVGANPDRSRDPIYSYGGEQPIRTALEAAQYLVSRLNPQLEQIGYVPYSSTASIVNELECLRRRGPENLDSPTCNPSTCTPGAEPPCDPDCGCFSGVITNTVLYQLNQTVAGGGSNVPDGIRLGLDVLSSTSPHFGRPEAARAMVLMTDGYANVHSSDTCHAQDYWPNNTGNSDIDRASDCVIYYAQQARNNGVVIYAVSLGYSADLELMQAVADLTGGFHRWAPSPDKLYEVFSDLLTGQANFTASPVAGVAPLTVTFVAFRDSRLSDLWMFGDGTYGMYISPTTPITLTHTYTQSGVYTVTLTAAGIGGMYTLIRTDYITVTRPPALALSKQAAPIPVQAGGHLTYTIVVTNTGDVALTAAITDFLPAGVTPGGILTWAASIAAPGVWVQEVTVTVTTAGPLTNVVQVTTDEGAMGIYTHTLVPALEITTQAAPTVQAGERLTYTISITNTGDFVLHAVITASLPAHVTPSGVLIWTAIITAPGDVWVQTIPVTVEMGYGGVVTNVVEVTTDEGAGGLDIATVSVICHNVYLPVILRLDLADDVRFK